MSLRRSLATAAAVAAIAALALTGCSSPAPGPTASTAGDEADLVTAGTLTVATEGTYRPFSYHDQSGELTGFDVEIAEEVAKKLGLTIAFKETQWDAIFAGLEAGRFDVIANQVSITDEREKKYVFSEPYTVSPGVVVVPENDDAIRSFADLKGKTTAQSLTSNWYALAQENGATVEPVEGWAQAVALLKQGRVDATINDKLTYLDYEKTDGPTGLKIAVTTEDAARNAFTFAKGGDALATKVDGALAELREEGVLSEISQKYFSADVTQ